MPLKIQIESGPNRGAQWMIDEGEARVFGRGGQSDVTLPDDPAISTHHFHLRVTGGTCEVQDLQSTNGTFVNGQRVQTLRLKDPFQLRAGTTEFRCQWMLLGGGRSPGGMPGGEAAVPRPIADPVVTRPPSPGAPSPGTSSAPVPGTSPVPAPRPNPPPAPIPVPPPAPGVGGSAPGVGGSAPGVGGSAPGVGGPAPGSGAPIPGSGGSANPPASPIPPPSWSPGGAGRDATDPRGTPRQDFEGLPPVASPPAPSSRPAPSLPPSASAGSSAPPPARPSTMGGSMAGTAAGGAPQISLERLPCDLYRGLCVDANFDVRQAIRAVGQTQQLYGVLDPSRCEPAIAPEDARALGESLIVLPDQGDTGVWPRLLKLSDAGFCDRMLEIAWEQQALLLLWSVVDEPILANHYREAMRVVPNDSHFRRGFLGLCWAETLSAMLQVDPGKRFCEWIEPLSAVLLPEPGGWSLYGDHRLHDLSISRFFIDGDPAEG